MTARFLYDVYYWAGAYYQTIYNINGQLVKRYLFDSKGSNSYFTTWDGKDKNRNQVSAGAYFCRLEGAGRSLLAKAVKIK